MAVHISVTGVPDRKKWQMQEKTRKVVVLTAPGLFTL